MPAFRFFDPWAAAPENAEAATVAKAAKVHSAPEPTLAALAGLAASRGQIQIPVGKVNARPLPADAGEISDGEAAKVAHPAKSPGPSTWTEHEEKRTTVVEHQADILGEWAEGFARLDPDRPPCDVPPLRWFRFVAHLRCFLASEFATTGVALGWGQLDLFGCDYDRPFARIDQLGLLWFLNGDRLALFTEDAATIEKAGGARHKYRRKAGAPGRVPAWELRP